MRYKRKRRQPYAARVREMRAAYQDRVFTGNDLRWAVIHCFYRKGLTLADTASVLGESIGNINFQVDMARQDAQ